MANFIKSVQITEQEGYQNIRQPALAFLDVFSKDGDMFLLVEQQTAGGPIKTRPVLKVLNENSYEPKPEEPDGTRYVLGYIGSTSPDGINVWHVFFEEAVSPTPEEP